MRSAITSNESDCHSYDADDQAQAEPAAKADPVAAVPDVAQPEAVADATNVPDQAQVKHEDASMAGANGAVIVNFLKFVLNPIILINF